MTILPRPGTGLAPVDLKQGQPHLPAMLMVVPPAVAILVLSLRTGPLVRGQYARH